MARDHEEVTYDGHVETETDLAWLFEIDGGEQVWFPKSQCELDDSQTSILVPLWLAKAKGLE